MQSPPTPEATQCLALRLVRPKNRADLRAAVDAFVAPDVRFYHSLGYFEGRSAYYAALRVATALWRYERVDFRDVFVSAPADGDDGGDGGTVKAALTMLLRVRLPLPLVRPLDFPTIAVLHFRRRAAAAEKEEDGGAGGGTAAAAANGRPFLLTQHVDSNSIVALATALSPVRVPWWVVERWILPSLGACGVAAARALDAAADARDALSSAVGAWLRPLQLLMD